jgi:hypothetical protein
MTPSDEPTNAPEDTQEPGGRREPRIHPLVAAPSAVAALLVMSAGRRNMTPDDYLRGGLGLSWLGLTCLGAAVLVVRGTWEVDEHVKRRRVDPLGAGLLVSATSPFGAYLVLDNSFLHDTSAAARQVSAVAAVGLLATGLLLQVLSRWSGWPDVLLPPWRRRGAGVRSRSASQPGGASGG